jgi:hypothetical protein
MKPEGDQIERIDGEHSAFKISVPHALIFGNICECFFQVVVRVVVRA